MNIFEDLFVLELANNHWGRVERGERIVRAFARVARYSNVKAAIKLQFRCPETFVHSDYRERRDLRYVGKTMQTALTLEGMARIVSVIRESGCIPAATPFDETSVEWCERLNLPFIKLASSDVNDWPLIERVAATRRPVIASTGGSSQKDVDDLVTFFERRGIMLALNHCVSLYPTEDEDLELNQIDFLRQRYPGHIVGFSTHEYHNWQDSMLIAYAKGARTFERHIDLPYDESEHAQQKTPTPYCSTPERIHQWFRAWHRAQALCGGAGTQKRCPPKEEVKYLNGLLRGVYAKRNLVAGTVITQDDIFLAIPLQSRQVSCRELILGQTLTSFVAENQPVSFEAVDAEFLIDERF